MYLTDYTNPAAMREIYLPPVAFQLLLKAATDGIQMYACQNEDPLPAHLAGKRIFTLFGVRYIEESVENFRNKPDMVYPVGNSRKPPEDVYPVQLPGGRWIYG